MKKIWRIILLLETGILMLFVTFFIYSAIPPKINDPGRDATDPEHFPYHVEPGYFPENGFVLSAKSAEKIGSAVIDSIVGKTSPIKACVYYDDENHVWMVSKSYLGDPGGVVYIDQKTGEVIKFLFQR